MKHLDFCPKIIVISQKKRSSLEISPGFHYFSLKTSDVGKNKRKRSFYIKSVFDFRRNFCQNRQDRAPKSCPKTIQRASVNSGTKVTQPGTRDARRQFRDCPGHSGTVGNPIQTTHCGKHSPLFSTAMKSYLMYSGLYFRFDMTKTFLANLLINKFYAIAT